MCVLIREREYSRHHETKLQHNTHHAKSKTAALPRLNHAAQLPAITQRSMFLPSFWSAVPQQPEAETQLLRLDLIRGNLDLIQNSFLATPSICGITSHNQTQGASGLCSDGKCQGPRGQESPLVLQMFLCVDLKQDENVAFSLSIHPLVFYQHLRHT